VAAWAGRPSGRFVLPLVAIVAILAATGAVGNYATRAGAPPPRPGASPSPSTGDPAPAGGDQVAPNPDSTGDSGALPAHPQDVVAQWAHRIGPAIGIPETALKAYGYATLREAADRPACHLSWTTLAGIGKVESGHGSANHATLAPDGFVLPPVIGPALNGQGGHDRVPDTDAGRYDGDRSYDHAIGPMQFLPSTWQQYQIDADNDGRADPNDINDAALAAARYLCAGGQDLATSGGWLAAVEAYNEPLSYVQAVFDAANDYGLKSRSVA
jgi:membrane-bound lytic murein transglycosylase B